MASVLAMISEILSISGSSLNVMLDCVCECTDFKHNFKSEREIKIGLSSLAELPRVNSEIIYEPSS